MKVRILTPLTAVAILAGLAPGAGAAVPPAPEAVPGQLVVGFDDGVSAARRSDLRDNLGLRRVHPLLAGARADVVAVPERSADALAARGRALERQPGVAYAEPNWVITPDRVPSDSFFFSRQWSLRNTGSFIYNGSTTSSTPGADIDAPRAWDLTTGSSSVLIAVVDTGVYAGHQDLDGKVDTLHDFDFVDNDTNADDSDSASLGHGTHVAGIAAGEANGHGTVGVAWGARVLPVRVLGGDPEGNAAGAANGLRYAATHGARIVNMSFGAAGESSAITSAIADHPETLFVAAAGNTGTNVPHYPCWTTLANIVCVANTTANDTLSPTSTYGAAAVDLAAPGDRIENANGNPATRSPGSYVFKSGTSMAAPHVSGIAALIKSLEPWQGPLAEKACIMAGADRLASLAGKVATSGRANARRALDACADRIAPDRAPVQIGPANGALLRPSKLSFTFAPGHDAQSGIAANSILMNGRAVAAGGPGTGSLAPFATVADGIYAWTARSTDRFGNSRDSGARVVAVDGTKPRLKLKLRARSAKRGIKARATLSEAVRITQAKVKLSRKVAKKIGTRRRSLGGKATKRLAKGKHSLKIKLPKAVRKHGAGRKIKLDLRLVDKAGNVAHKRFSVKLK